MRLAVQLFRGFLASALTVLFVFSPNLFAETHVVTSQEVQREVLRSSQQRKHNQETVQELLSTDTGRKAIRSLHADQAQVTHAIAHLSDAELARLAERAQKAQADFAAGAMSKEALLIVAIAVVVVIVIVVAKT